MAAVQSGVFLLVLLLLPLPSTPTTLYVTPGSHTTCPAHPCLTLSEYVENATEYFTSNTTMIFLPGEHVFDVQANVTDVNGFSMLSESEGTSTIICSGSGCGGFYFEEVSCLDMTNLSFVSDSQSITVAHVFDFRLVNCTFANSSNTAIISINSSLLLEGNVFLNNSGGGVLWMTFKPGGGISVIFSNITFHGQNIFRNNTCISDTRLCGGGAMYAENSTVNLEGNSSFIDNTVMASKYLVGPFISGGGGLLLLQSTVYITGHVYFTNNSASNAVVSENSCTCGGGGASLLNCDASVSGEVTFSSNVAMGESGCGGGMYVYGSSADGGETILLDSNMSVKGSLLLTGNSGSQGGGFIVQHNSNMDITGTMLLANNSAGLQGGGISVESSRMTASGSVSFTNNSASNGGGTFVDSSYVTFENTLFTADNADNQDGGMTVSGGVLFTDNSASNYGGGIASSFSNITLGYALFTTNNADSQGGGMDFQEGNLLITGTVSFINNSAGLMGGGVIIVAGSATLAGNISFTGNYAPIQGGGIGVGKSNVSLTGSVVLTDNHAGLGGGIDVGRGTVVISGTVLLTNNSAGSQGGGIGLTGAKLNITGTLVLTSNNAGSAGGGMNLDAKSQISVSGKVYFTDNSALSNGGAIFTADASPLLYCATIVGAECMVGDCFFQIDTNTSHSIEKLLVFEGNIAESGSILYGGSVDNCRLEADPEAHSGEVFDMIADYSKQADTLSVITSDPFRVCICDGDQACIAVKDITTYPGQTFPVTVAAVGQRNGTHIGTINAITTPTKMSRLDAFEDRQVVTDCNKLYYTTFSNENTTLKLQMYVDGSCSSLDGSKNNLHIPVHLLPCPPAFTLSESTQGCICEERLQKFTNRCDINNQTIERDGDFWVGYDNQSSHAGLILHPHCPFDYCKTNSINFTLNDTDRQCKGDRSGLLCGACKPNHSLALGSSRCLSCSDAYLSLLIPFAVMGVVLVFFLLACRLTVALGTLSGVVFYANIVQANRSTFFPSGSTNPLTVFIAWLNLDLGIETCFYDGMDAYAKTWLQFAFPIYIWGVIGIIMFISSQSITISRMLGRNPVEVLATLFLLSYTKILRTIITALSLADLQYPNESQVVWLNDANIRYLEGKHIPLFVVGLLFFVLLFLPYTLLLLLGQWLLAWSNLKILFWVNNTKLKAFLDSYYSPYEERHRYWTGLLLVVRFALLLVFGTNVFGEDSENLLAISAASVGLLVWPWMIGTVYKNWYLGALEASFILNLSISAAATSYVQQAGGNQAVVAYTSTSIAFATFIAILLYHIDLRIKVSQFLKAFCCRMVNQPQGNEHEREFLVADVGGRALAAPARPYYGSGEFREPLLDAQ